MSTTRSHYHAVGFSVRGATPAADTCAIVVAGGLGLRFGDPRGKQFVEVCGLPVLDWSIAAFDVAASVASIAKPQSACPRELRCGRCHAPRIVLGGPALCASRPCVCRYP